MNRDMMDCLFYLGFQEKVLERYFSKTPEWNPQNPKPDDVHKAAYSLAHRLWFEPQEIKESVSYPDIDSLIDNLIEFGIRQDLAVDLYHPDLDYDTMAHRGPYLDTLDLIDFRMKKLFPHFPGDRSTGYGRADFYDDPIDDDE
ncbi:hypothetical protein GMAR_ORF295 [Golden Marseillevirus]|uniref:hypothetical protein n=1 Tax=Golden Marseillevirus TaxID=1720526 RepID=UPI000877AA1F|nr:hypothetical protein GMAR_ORF295 [Golden Marseillevirus]ALX27669.1 hypothetical protein GMAR_ORF295 [Golden Marseillevirus]